MMTTVFFSVPQLINVCCNKFIVAHVQYSSSLMSMYFPLATIMTTLQHHKFSASIAKSRSMKLETKPEIVSQSSAPVLLTLLSNLTREFSE